MAVDRVRSRPSIVLGWVVIGLSFLLWQTPTPVAAPRSNAADQSTFGREAPPRRPPVTVLIVYYSLTGNTEKMARAVADGVRLVSQATAVIKKPGEVSSDDLKGADGIVLGSPTYWSNMAAPIKAFIDDWWLKYQVPLNDKVGGAFSSGAGETGGKENVIYSLNLAMMNGGMILVGPLEAGFGLAGVSALDPVNDKALKECRALGERVATVAQRLKTASQLGASKPQ
jgi:NAD(P)H dehydrogenase (quinone)